MKCPTLAEIYYKDYLIALITMSKKNLTEEERREMEEFEKELLQSLESGPICGTPWLNEREKAEQEKDENK